MQVEQLLNNPFLQYLCLQKGQQLTGETSPESRNEGIHGHCGGGQQII